MNAAVAVDHSPGRILAHPSRADMVMATGQRRRPGGDVSRQPVLDLETAEAGAAELQGDRLVAGLERALVELGEPPVEGDPRQPERVTLLDEAHTAVGVGRLLGGAQRSHSIMPTSSSSRASRSIQGLIPQ